MWDSPVCPSARPPVATKPTFNFSLTDLVRANAGDGPRKSCAGNSDLGDELTAGSTASHHEHFAVYWTFGWVDICGEDSDMAASSKLLSRCRGGPSQAGSLRQRQPEHAS